MSTPVTESLEADLAELPPESQLRVNTIADMPRDMIGRDSESDETCLAMLLVLEEIDEEDLAVEMDLAQGETRQ